MSYYPIFLDLAGRRCLVVGGGAVAERKVEGLLAAGAQVTIVAPDLLESLRALVEQHSIAHVARKYEHGDLEGYALAFVATDDRAINAAVSRDGRSCGVWVNCTDDPDYCDFILPAVIRRGEIALAISTGGASPALARALREELEAFLTGDLTQLIQTISEVRAELKERSIRVRPESWNEALKGEFRLLVAQGRAADAKQLLIRRLEDRPCG
jgi:precorrin-2 dehydrogenase / sirohydrochlorin ferrochelatase